MKKLALGALFAGLAACGGGSDKPVFVDAPSGGDGGAGACNPLTQTGCNAGEKCTWINDQDNPPIGHVGCAPDGTVAIGAACTDPPAGPMGYDQCVKGSVCLSGECKQICDQNGGAPTCDANHSCTRYADFFEVGGTAVAGVCDPGCDPLTQDLKLGAVPACGSTDPTMPSKGCYGYDDYSCAPSGMTTWTLTDRQPPRTNASGNPYLNGCAPGFIPFFFEMTGSTMTLCSGLCSALEVDNTTIGGLTPAQRDDGDATAIGKLPTTAKAAGDATCGTTKKGSRPSSTCRFMWPYLEDDQGMLTMAFEQSVYLDTLGVCMAIEFFQYDTNMDMMPDTPYPSCTTLPRTGAGDDDSADDWGCLKRSNSMFVSGRAKLNPALKDIRLPKNAAMQMVRHNLN
jgi:hypothetical protein